MDRYYEGIAYKSPICKTDVGRFECQRCGYYAVWLSDNWNFEKKKHEKVCSKCYSDSFPKREN